MIGWILTAFALGYLCAWRVIRRQIRHEVERAIIIRERDMLDAINFPTPQSTATKP